MEMLITWYIDPGFARGTPDMASQLDIIIEQYNALPDHLKPKKIYVNTVGLGGEVLEDLREHHLPVQEVGFMVNKYVTFPEKNAGSGHVQ